MTLQHPAATSDRSSKTPVTLVTGFLGSGKTTLISRLLAHPDLGETAVIVNELGEVGIDHHLRGASTSERFCSTPAACAARSGAISRTSSATSTAVARGGRSQPSGG